jgi:hypothetical protein
MRMRTGYVITLAGLLTLAGASGEAAAQIDAASMHKARMRKIEQTVADTGANAVSLRNLGVDLRVPGNFEHVYEIEPAAGWGGRGTARSRGVLSPRSQQRQFARVSGAITAVFPQSTYVQVPLSPQVAVQGQTAFVPLIPAGTIFHIGTPNLPVQRQASPATPPPLLADVGLPLATAIDSRDVSGLPVGSRVMTTGAGTRETRAQRPDRSVPSPAEPTPQDIESDLRARGPSIMTDDGYRARRVREILHGAAGGQ